MISVYEILLNECHHIHTWCICMLIKARVSLAHKISPYRCSKINNPTEASCQNYWQKNIILKLSAYYLLVQITKSNFVMVYTVFTKDPGLLRPLSSFRLLFDSTEWEKNAMVLCPSKSGRIDTSLFYGLV